MSEINTAELRELLAAATPGEWKATFSYHGANHWGLVRAPGHVVCETAMMPTGSTASTDEDAAFIAAAHNAMPAMLDAIGAQAATIKAQAEEIERLREALNDARALPLFDDEEA